MVKNRDAKWTALQPKFVFSCSTAPKLSRLASQTFLIGWFLLKCCISVTACIALFISSNALSRFSVQSRSFSLLTRRRSGAHKRAEFGKNLFFWLMDPMNQRSSFRFFGLCCLLLPKSFLGLIPFCDNVKPKFLRKFTLFNFQTGSGFVDITSFIFSMCCWLFPFVTTKLSFIIANVNRMLCKSSSIIFWISGGIIVNP